jgi:peptidoglycan/xylan/chitin deacetylase (PgdA/CDA1 family)
MNGSANTAGFGVSLRRTLCYHEFSRTPSKDVYQLTPAMFSAHLLAALRGSRRNGAEVEITFDDAHRSQLELAVPVLEDIDLRGLFFVPAAWVGVRPETASWSALRELLAAGHSIGSHGDTHALFTLCTRDALTEELQRSRDTLQQKLGVPINSISAPGGRWNLEVVEACVQAGYRTLYTSEPTGRVRLAVLDRSLDIQGRLVLRRTMSEQTAEHYVEQEPALAARLIREYKIKTGLRQAFGEGTYQTLWRLLLRSPSAHD